MSQGAGDTLTLVVKDDLSHGGSIRIEIQTMRKEKAYEAVGKHPNIRISKYLEPETRKYVSKLRN